MIDYSKIVYEAIKDAWTERLEDLEIESCIRDAMFCGVDVCRAIKTGVIESLPAECDVLDALAAGTYYAVVKQTSQDDTDGQADNEGQKVFRQRRTRYKKVAQDGSQAR